jgi:tRNA dimethylallyltransferase
MALDARRAEIIDRHNRVRLVRAIEIATALGSVPILEEKGLRYPTHIYLLSPSKEILISRIEKRLEKRLEGHETINMLFEAKMLRSKNLLDTTIESLGLEYRWMNIYLKGECSYDEMKQHILIDSWHYAKRQMTWNKKYEGFAEKILP